MTALAGIDCGTNSTRLLVADADGWTVQRLMRITRLGQGVDANGRLAPEAIARTVAVLEEYREVLDRHGVDSVRMTATSAARDASNRDDFFTAAATAVGVPPELLGGEEEGRLAFRGATADLDPADGPFLVVDIGGGSTEFVLGDAGGVRAARSVDVGCVRLTERHLHGNPPTADEIQRAEADIRAAAARAVADLRDQVTELAIGAAEQVVVSSLDHDTQVRLIEDYINRVGASRS